MKKAFINWSSGKDAAFALFKVSDEKDCSVEKLVTTYNTRTERVSMHGLKIELLLEQACAVGIPLHLIPLQGDVGMLQYNSIMEQENLLLREEGFTHSIFGDIFLEDLRQYREEQLKKAGLEAVFPLWERSTAELMNNFIDSGFKAIVVSVNASVLDESFCGRIIDQNFLNDLPAGVDPCGENGEFHTFVFDGPLFKTPVNFRKGGVVQKNFTPKEEDQDNCFSNDKKTWDSDFYYLDLLPQ